MWSTSAPTIICEYPSPDFEECGRPADAAVSARMRFGDWCSYGVCPSHHGDLVNDLEGVGLFVAVTAVYPINDPSARRAAESACYVSDPDE